MSVRIHVLHPSNVDVWLELPNLNLEEADRMIKRLLAAGYRPASTASATGEWPKGPDGSPLCPKHHVVMQKRERQGDTWYSHKIRHPQTGRELYCRGYRYGEAAKDGYLVDV